jgi:hypothetical protein
MTSIRPGRWSRFQVELSAAGVAAIRDAASGELHHAPSVEDAFLDASYLNGQHAAGDAAEVARHLAFLTDFSAASPRPNAEPLPPADAEEVLDAALDWSEQQSAASAADTARSEHHRLASLRREVESARTAVDLAAARVTEALHVLYAHPETAHTVLAHTSSWLDPAELAALVRTQPAVFGDLAVPNVRRFGESAAADMVRARAESLGSAIDAHTRAQSAFNSMQDAVAAALSASPHLTAPELSEFLDARIRELAARADALPPHSLDRAADRLRAFLAAADKKTRDAVLRRFPGAARISREARAHSTSLSPEL